MCNILQKTPSLSPTLVEISILVLSNPILQCTKKYNMLEQKMNNISGCSNLCQVSVNLPFKLLLNTLWSSNLINKSMNNHKSAILYGISTFEKTLHFCRENLLLAIQKELNKCEYKHWLQKAYWTGVTIMPQSWKHRK